MADLIDDVDFAPRSEHSTTGIFYEDEDTGHAQYLIWQPVPIQPPRAPLGLGPILNLRASSTGLVVWHHPILNYYYVGNPFVDPTYHEYEDDVEEEEDMDDVGFPYNNHPLLSPLRYHHPDQTHVVLAVHDPYDALSPIWHMICAVNKGDSIYTFDTYSSNTDVWGTLPGVNLHPRGNIVRNSGISCGRFVYWLLMGLDVTPRSVLRFDVMGNDMPEIISFLELPPWVPPEARVQLGRVGNRLGLVVVNEVRSRVELYALQRPRRSGNQNPWTRIDFFSVELQDANPSLRERDKTIFCREMPRPIRFESFKVELLFWVQGQVLLLQNSNADPHRYRLQVILAPNMPAWIIDGMPHVCTYLLPVEFLIFEY